MTDDRPTSTKSYRLPDHLKGEVDRQVKELLNQGTYYETLKITVEFSTVGRTKEAKC